MFGSSYKAAMRSVCTLSALKQPLPKAPFDKRINLASQAEIAMECPCLMFGAEGRGLPCCVLRASTPDVDVGFRKTVERNEDPQK